MPTKDGFARPVKLAVRCRGEWIHAIWCVNEPGAEDSPEAMTVSKLATWAADKDRQLFEEWVKVLNAWMGRTVQSFLGSAVQVERIDIVRHFNPEGN